MTKPGGTPWDAPHSTLTLVTAAVEGPRSAASRNDSNASVIAEAVIALAHSLKLHVTAEGVETPEQLAFLKKHQCDYMQGYLFSKPLPHPAFEQVMKAQSAL